MFSSNPDLAALRQSKGITLQQIAESTKISIRYLRAIEEGRLTILPGGVYSISYIRQYAQAIDYQLVMEPSGLK
jgi:cytoskeletal protein RodZ